jgi:hypothetical protein
MKSCINCQYKSSKDCGMIVKVQLSSSGAYYDKRPDGRCKPRAKR